VIRIRGVIPHRKALFDVAAAGPLAGFAVALPVFVAGMLFELRPVDGPLEPGGYIIGPPLLSSVFQMLIESDGSPLRVGSLYGAGWVGMLVTSMNLFPVGQLDGGHAACAVSRTLHRRLALATIAAMFGLVALQVLTYPGIPAYTLWLVVLLLMRDRHPRLADESIPLGPGRRLVAVLLALLFVVSFIPVPLVLL
jgi:membrane-associated protease RseP (regulator of RpoE activity)